MEQSNLARLIDVPRLQRIADALYRASGIPAGLLDENGALLVVTTLMDVCHGFHRARPAARVLCDASDAQLVSLSENASFETRVCPAGLRSIIVPIRIAGQRCGTLALGPFFYDDETPDEAFFAAQAERFGFETAAYLEAMRRVPMFKRERIEDIREFYSGLVDMISEQGLVRLELEEELTARRTVEARLNERLVFIRTLLDTVPMPVFAKDRDGVYNECNAAYAEMLGAPPENVVGKSVHEIFPEPQASIYATADKQLFAHPGRQIYQTTMPNAAGDVRDVIISKSTYPGPDGRIAGMVGAVTDVTELERAQAEIAERERQYRLLAENADDVIAVLDIDLRYRYVSPSVERLLGYTPEEALRLSISERLTPESCRKAHELRNEFMEGERAGRAMPTIWRNEFEQVRKDGRVIWTESVITPLRDQTGAVTGLLSVSRDISARKLAEESLRESEERFRSIVDLLPQYVAHIGADLRYRYVNPTYAKLFDLPQSHFVGKHLAEVLGPSAVETIRGNIEAVLRGETVHYTAPIPLPDGRVRLIDGRYFAGYDDNGAIDSFYAFLTDLTELTNAQSALRESEERYALAVAGANDGIWDWSVATGEVYFAPRWKEIIGYADAELPNEIESWKSRIHPDDIDRVIAANQEVLDGAREHFSVEYRLRHKDGSWRWVLGRGAAMRNAAGRAVRMAGAHSDITERKAMEEELRAARDRAEAASKAKSEFLANMSHEMRTPLNGILGMAEAAQGSRDPVFREKSLDLIARAGKNLLAIINDLLDLAQIEAGKLTRPPAPFDPAEAVSSTVETYASLAASKGLTLATDIRPGLPRMLMGDRTSLVQILSNLVGNALKFTASGSVRVTVSIDNGDLVLNVADTGIGIPTERAPELFQKFAQLDSSPAKRFGGAGLGLAITKGLVDMLGGEVSLDSAPGRGSTFTVRLPLPEHKHEAAPGASPKSAVSGISDLPPLRILIAEDEAINRLFLESVLERAGHTVTGVGSGREALDSLAADDFDLVLMDVQMPELDGVTATRLLRSGKDEVRNPNVPVVALTAYAMQGDRERFLTAGMDGYVSKPVELSTLAREIGRVLRSRKAGCR